MIKKGISLHTIKKTWKIDRHTLINWKNNDDQLKLVNNKDKLFRKIRSGLIYRYFSATEEDLLKFNKNIRKNHKAVSTKLVFAFAYKLNEKNFKENACNFTKMLLQISQEKWIINS